jgi:hypothetical protein
MSLSAKPRDKRALRRSFPKLLIADQKTIQFPRENSIISTSTVNPAPRSVKGLSLTIQAGAEESVLPGGDDPHEQRGKAEFGSDWPPGRCQQGNFDRSRSGSPTGLP